MIKKCEIHWCIAEARPGGTCCPVHYLKAEFTPDRNKLSELQRRYNEETAQVAAEAYR